MAHITFNFHSQVLDFHQTVHLLVPDANIYGALAGGADTEEIPVLYLLHGLKGAAHTWTSYTSIERYLYESEKKMVEMCIRDRATSDPVKRRVTSPLKGW